MLLSDYVSRQEIIDLLHRRARAADRCDLELLAACHSPGSTDNHGFFAGTTEALVAKLAEREAQGPACLAKMHRIGNVLIDLAGDQAFCETYHVAHESYSRAEGATDHVIVGRYLDELSRRSGRWLISSRSVVYDWSRTLAATRKFWEMMSYTAHLRGSRSDADPLYEHPCVIRGALPPAAELTAPHAAAGVSDKEVSRLLDRQTITEIIYRRSRGYDRRDLDLILACYHKGATERHGGIDGAAKDFVEKVFGAPKKYPPRSTSHMMTNVQIDFHAPDSAFAESYTTNYISRPSDSGMVDVTFGGRYLDKFERRDGAWAITHCDVVFDWSRMEPETSKFWDMFPGSQFVFGTRDATDPLYAHVERGR